MSDRFTMSNKFIMSEKSKVERFFMAVRIIMSDIMGGDHVYCTVVYVEQIH